MIQNKLKEQLRCGEAAIGLLAASGSPDMIEIAGLAGFNFVVIDCEHGFIGPESTQNQIRAAELRGITPIVRIPNATESQILHNLDIGAHGIQIPNVNNAQVASDIVTFSKYFPVGRRGIAFPRAADYAMGNLDEYFDHENEQTMIIIHCENKASLENLEEICQIPEIDVVFLGPYDMSQSLGVRGQVTHPKIEEAAQKILDVTKKHNKIAGIYAGGGAAAKVRAKQGFRYILIGIDTVLFGQKCKQEVEAFKE